MGGQDGLLFITIVSYQSLSAMSAHFTPAGFDQNDCLMFAITVCIVKVRIPVISLLSIKVI
jgi:hypothetical protein